jgi:phage tail tape-measure protein
MTKNFAANMKIGAMMGSSVGRVFNGVNKKVKEQEATLKKLRSAYADAAKGSGAFVGSLAKMEREITSAEAKLKRLQAAAKIDLGKSMKGIGSKFWGDTKRLGMVGGVMGAAGLGLAKNMLDTTAAFEKSLTILKTVEGSAEKAGKSFEWIQDFAQKTPFELQQVTDAFVRLRAYGIDPISENYRWDDEHWKPAPPSRFADGGDVGKPRIGTIRVGPESCRGDRRGRAVGVREAAGSDYRSGRIFDLGPAEIVRA